MQLTSLSRYALPALAYLATAGCLAGCDEIARACGVSSGYLARVLILLRQAGIVDGLKGPRGGFRLARPAREITLLDVVEATEGAVLGYIMQPVEGAGKALDCQLQTILDRAAKVYRRAFRKVRLSDLAQAGARR